MHHRAVRKAKRQTGSACRDAKPREADVTAAFSEHEVEVIEPVAARLRDVHHRPVAGQVPTGFVFKPWFM